MLKAPATPLSSLTAPVTNDSARRRYSILAIELLVMGVLPVLLAFAVFDLRHWDLTVPIIYSGFDDVWQLILTKMVRDTGWFLNSPYLAAPDIAHWHFHSAAQTSSLHSIIMWVMSWFIDDAVKIQQLYYLMNFGLISLSTYFTCRALGLARWAAGSAGFLFAFTSFRIGWLFYAFLANYAAVPLAFLPVIWIIAGQFAQAAGVLRMGAALRDLLVSRKFWIGQCCIVLVTLSDGYYAFFTLLMLAFATCVRAALGDWRRPARLLAPFLFIATLAAVALGMTMPLQAYQRAHVQEFMPDGKPDPSLIKHPFEAEVYSSSLKLMVAPVTGHRIPALAELGKKMVESSDLARKFPVTKPVVSLGSIASLLLLTGLCALPVVLLRRRSAQQTGPSKIALVGTFGAAAALSYFTFLAAIAGGLGTLVALVYPTIRAYDRMALFLAFALLVGAGALATARWQRAAGGTRWLVYFGAAALTALGVADQIPADFASGNPLTAKQFVAERKLVHRIEKALPANTMVYQYPHSQYLTDSKYYGWASFAHMRLYLHSNRLHWSNGGAKNSAVENWHEKIALLPFDRMLTELEAVGFRAMVIDRTVVKDTQYQQIKAALLSRGLQLEEDSDSKLAWLRLPDPGYRVSYNADFSGIERLVVGDRATFDKAALPRLVDSVALRAAAGGDNAAAITRKAYPNVFLSVAQADRGMGDKPVLPLGDMTGAVRCELAPGNVAEARLTIENDTAFDWQFGSGRVPLALGVHVRGADDAMIRFDDGTRVAPGNWFVPAHGKVEFAVPMLSISRAGLPSAPGMRAEFVVVQDGHAWFGQLSCKVPMPTQHQGSLKG